MTALDIEKQKKAKEYARIRRRLWVLDTVVDLAYASAWLGIGWSLSLRDWLTALTGGLPADLESWILERQRSPE